MLTRSRRRQIEMADEQNREAVYGGENTWRNELQSELDRDGDHEGASDENAKILAILEEVKLVVRELETERKADEEVTARLIGQNEELTKRLTSIESERVAERLSVADLEIRLDTLEQRAEESTMKFDGVWQKMSTQLEKRVDKLESYKVDIRKEYLEHFADRFEALLVAVEGLDRHIQIMENKYKEQETALHKLTHTEQRKQRIQLSPLYARQMEQTEQKSPLTQKYSREPEAEYNIDDVLTKARTEYKEQTDRTYQERKVTRTISQKPIQQPPKYDGKTSWEAFCAQFDIAARMNGWNDEDKAAFLATSLQGNATLVLSNLSEQDRRNYKLLVAALTSRFVVTHQSELARAKLKNRVKRRDETLPELVEGIESLTRVAYPDASQELQDVLARDHFIDALTDEDLRLRIRQAKPQSLQKALEIALELESFQLASKHRNRLSSGPIGHLRKVEKDATGPPVQSRSEKEDEKEGRFERLENTINELIKEIKAQSRRQRPRRSPTD